jgi:hypothetical protein
MPQPDLALLAPRKDFYESVGPSPADVLLVVEVSDSTLRFDCDVKLPLYARQGIPEAWIVDVQRRELRICRTPRDGRSVEHDVVAATGGVSFRIARSGARSDGAVRLNAGSDVGRGPTEIPSVATAASRLAQ